MWQLIGGSVGLILTQKSACTSIKQALVAAGRLGPPVTAKAFVAGADRRVLFMREPYLRAASAYRMYRGRGKLNGDHHSPQGHDLRSFEAFILGICEDRRRDPHVEPQVTSCVSRKGVWLPTHIIRWDWAALTKIVGLTFGKWNSTAPERVDTAWTPAALEAFAVTYRDDLALWEARQDRRTAPKRHPPKWHTPATGPAASEAPRG